jgi:hypothetical protein
MTGGGTLTDPIDVLPRSRSLLPIGPSAEVVLGSTLVEIVRRVLKDELSAHLAAVHAPPPTPWMTPPSASRTSGVPVKTIRAWVRTGRISKRLKNRSADPKQLKYLVNVNEVVAIAERWEVASTEVAGEPSGVEERARQILAARAARGR